MFIDPFGLDTVELQQGNGNLVNHTEAKGDDVFYMVDEDGNRLEDQSITFDEGTLEDVRQPTIKVQTKEGDIKKKRLTLFEMKGDESTTQLFEFLADPANTNVEWTHAKIGTDDSDKNIVGSSHDKSSTPVGHYLRVTNYTLKEVIHNHPSGNGPSPADIKNAILFHNKNPNTKLKVYIHPPKYIPYNKYGLEIEPVIIHPN